MNNEILNDLIKFSDKLYSEHGIVFEPSLYAFLRNRVPSHEVADYVKQLMKEKDFKGIQLDLSFRAIPESNN